MTREDRDVDAAGAETWGEGARRLHDAAIRLAGRDDLTARLSFAALADRLTASGDRFVVVGGTAVDAYVGGAFGSSEGYPAGWTESLDVDTVVLSPLGSGREQLREKLEAAGFQPSSTGGSFSLEAIPYALDVVARRLPDDFSEGHLVQVSLHVEELANAEDETQPARITLVGPEDLLFDYLESAVSTHHQRDWARALSIAEVLGYDLDLGYLYSKAHDRRSGEFVANLDQLLAGEPLPSKE
jgi:hypothetical protein